MPPSVKADPTQPHPLVRACPLETHYYSHGIGVGPHIGSPQRAGMVPALLSVDLTPRHALLSRNSVSLVRKRKVIVREFYKGEVVLGLSRQVRGRHFPSPCFVDTNQAQVCHS